MRLKTPEAQKELDDAVELFLKKVEPLAASGYLYGEKQVCLLLRVFVIMLDQTSNISKLTSGLLHAVAFPK